MQPLTVVLLVILSVVLAYEATRLSILVSFRQNLLDLPNPRSSHAGPMPRVGGVGILSGFYLSMAALWWLGSWSPAVEATPTRALAVGLIAGGTMGLTGLYDDLHGLRFSAKLAIQSLLAAAVITVGMQLESVWLPLQPSVQLGVLSIPLTFIWLVAFPNVYNFMDGIDGLAGGTAVVYGVFFFLIAWGQGNPGAALVALVLAGSCFGFSLHNFPPARTFMGDTGSLFLGMLFALLVVWLAQATADPGCLVALLLVCSVFLYDSVFTVLRRLRYGENIFQAHRSHLYQRLVGAGLSHRTVTSLYLSLHVLVGCLALVYLRVPNAGRTVIVIVVLLLLLLHTRGVLWLEEHAQRRTESVVQSTEERQARDAERVGKEEEPL
jgi:UDP-N-acetylmuramyl pentapeptide phosphotransferase/UDP-N-acetylglucosamine-1-phosphate transferase